MPTLTQDFRYGLRMLAKDPGFTAVALLTLALGIGANTSIFSVVDAALLRPLPYKDSSGLVMIWNQLRRLGLNEFPASFADCYDYQSLNKVFEGIAAFQPTYLDLAGGDRPERVYGIRTSANLFPLLGVKTEQGRTFIDQENRPGSGNVAILSNAIWRRRFGADRGLVGRTITLDGELLTVVGILGRDFRFSMGSSESPDVWLPLTLRPDPGRETGGLLLIARLKPGVPLSSARADMKTIAAGLERQYHLYRGPHGEDAGYDVTVIPLREQIFGSLRKGLLIMLGSSGFVLLIAWANATNLLLAKGTARHHEIAVRAALGANRKRLASQLVTEALLLAFGGAGVGLLLALAGVRLLIALSPHDASRALDARLNMSVLGFATALAVMTSLIFGIVPALRASKIDLNTALKEGGRSAASASHTQLRSWLVVAEVALSVVLLAGAGLLIRSLAKIDQVGPGFNPENVVTASISLPRTEYSVNSRVTEFYSQLLVGVRALHDVQAASLISAPPLSGAATRDPFSIEGRPWQAHGAENVPQVANFHIVAPDYFHTMQIPLIEGRDFDAHDTSDAAAVAIVNETMVRGFWAGRDPLGQHIMLGAPRPGAPWLTIVGVAGDVRSSGLESTPLPQIYVPQLQHPSWTMTIVLRVSPGATRAVAGVESVVRGIDRDRPVYDVATMEEVLSNSLASRRYNALLLSLFASLAVVLAGIGIYGVISYTVSQKVHEIGVRTALGARREDVMRLVVGQGFRLTVVGVTIGTAGALALARFLSSLLYGVKPTDPGTFLAVSLLLVGVALAASYIPARRATKVDPMVALRHE